MYIKCALQNSPCVLCAGQADSKLLGIIMRNHLIVLLSNKKIFQTSAGVSPGSMRLALNYHTADFVKPVSVAGPRIEDLRLSEEEMDMYLDLGPFVNSASYIVHEDSSLAKVGLAGHKLRMLFCVHITVFGVCMWARVKVLDELCAWAIFNDLGSCIMSLVVRRANMRGSCPMATILATCAVEFVMLHQAWQHVVSVPMPNAANWQSRYTSPNSHPPICRHTLCSDRWACAIF